MFKMAQMYFQDKLKPRQIASKLNFANKFVRDHLYLIRKKLKQLKHIDDNLQSADDIPFETLRFQIMEVIDPMPHHRQTRSRVNEELLVDTVGQCIKTNGLHQLTIQQVRSYIAESQIPGLKVPCKETVSMILKEQFLLRHVKYDGAIARYRDPLYNDRRIWLARILTQLICEDVLIVSIDETHFRSDNS
jgi:hypothetical protein